jgi:hypothetical protein
MNEDLKSSPSQGRWEGLQHFIFDDTCLTIAALIKFGLQSYRGRPNLVTARHQASSGPREWLITNSQETSYE